MDSFHRSFQRWIELESNYNDLFRSVVCGGAAGIVAKTAIAPAERVKMSFQTTSDRFTIGTALRRGRDIVQRDGVLSLWRGHSTTILRVAPYAGLSYAFHDAAEREMKRSLQVERLPFAYKFLAGSVAGAGGTLCTYPLDVLRVRLALTPGSTWASTIRQGGLFQGLLPTILGIVPYSGTAWAVKSHISDHYPLPGSGPDGVGRRCPTVVEMLIMNSIAGLFGQFVTYPLDIVRRRMQMASPASSNRLSMLRVLKHLVETEGFRGLAKGFSVNVIKGPITLSLSFTTYDLLSRAWIA